MSKDNMGSIPLADLLKSAPMRATMGGEAGTLINVQAKTDTGIISLVAEAENDITAMQEVKLVKLEDGIDNDKFSGISKVIRRAIVRGV